MLKMLKKFQGKLWGIFNYEASVPEDRQSHREHITVIYQKFSKRNKLIIGKSLNKGNFQGKLWGISTIMGSCRPVVASGTAAF